MTEKIDLLIYDKNLKFGLLVIYHKNQIRPLVKVITTQEELKVVYTYCVEKGIQKFSSSTYGDIANTQEWVLMPKRLLQDFYMDLMLYTNKKIYLYQCYSIINEHHTTEQLHMIENLLPTFAKVEYFQSIEEYQNKEKELYNFETYTIDTYMKECELVIYLTDSTKKSIKKKKPFNHLKDAFKMIQATVIYSEDDYKKIQNKLLGKLSPLNKKSAIEDYFGRRYKELFNKVTIATKNGMTITFKEQCEANSEKFKSSLDDNSTCDENCKLYEKFFKKEILFTNTIFMEHYNTCPYCKSKEYTVLNTLAHWNMGCQLICPSCKRRLLEKRYIRCMGEGCRHEDHMVFGGDAVKDYTVNDIDW